MGLLPSYIHSDARVFLFYFKKLLRHNLCETFCNNWKPQGFGIQEPQVYDSFLDNQGWLYLLGARKLSRVSPGMQQSPGSIQLMDPATGDVRLLHDTLHRSCQSRQTILTWMDRGRIWYKVASCVREPPAPCMLLDNQVRASQFSLGTGNKGWPGSSRGPHLGAPVHQNWLCYLCQLFAQQSLKGRWGSCGPVRVGSSLWSMRLAWGPQKALPGLTGRTRPQRRYLTGARQTH